MHIFPTVRDFTKFNNFVPIATIIDYIFLSFSPFYYFPKTLLNLPVFISIQVLFIEVVLSIKTLLRPWDTTMSKTNPQSTFLMLLQTEKNIPCSEAFGFIHVKNLVMIGT